MKIIITLLSVLGLSVLTLAQGLPNEMLDESKQLGFVSHLFTIKYLSESKAQNILSITDDKKIQADMIRTNPNFSSYNKLKLQIDQLINQLVMDMIDRNSVRFFRKLGNGAIAKNNKKVKDPCHSKTDKNCSKVRWYATWISKIEESTHAWLAVKPSSFQLPHKGDQASLDPTHKLNFQVANQHTGAGASAMTDQQILIIPSSAENTKIADLDIVSSVGLLVNFIKGIQEVKNGKVSAITTNLDQLKLSSLQDFVQTDEKKKEEKSM